MKVLLVILTGSISVLVFSSSIWLQFIYKLIFIYDLFLNWYYFWIKCDYHIIKSVLSFVLNSVLICVSIYVSICVLNLFQLHFSIYVSIISIDTKGIILFHNDKFVSRVVFTKGFTSVLRGIIISLASWQLSIYISLNSY